jgi:hypothetical protein
VPSRRLRPTQSRLLPGVGHASLSTTESSYAHLEDGLFAGAPAGVEQAIWSAVKPHALPPPPALAPYFAAQEAEHPARGRVTMTERRELFT